MDIEAAGLTRFDLWRDGSTTPAVERIYSELRIESGSTIDWPEGPSIIIALPGQGGFVSAEGFIAALEAEASKRDNQDKLIRAAGEESHLFVWVDSSSNDAWSPLAMGMMPERPARLPDSITHAWLASSSAMTDHFRVVRFSPQSLWHDYGLVRAKTPWR